MPIISEFVTPFRAAVAEQFEAQPLVPGRTLLPADLDGLPEPVRRYVQASGAVGRPVPWNLRVVFDAQMRLAPDRPPMPARSLQYNFFDRPARLFFMSARLFGAPIQALHRYQEGEATFQVRVGHVFNAVDQAGPALSAAETVTVLNDLCLMAPGRLTDPRLSWRAIDERTCAVTFANEPHTVTATLAFEGDRLVEFASDDRPDASTGHAVAMRWRTPVAGYAERGGMRLPTGGSAVYDRPEGPFEYGSFRLHDLAYDVAPPGRR